ncbi:membrane-associated protease RseP (regulator of RpoE activity) [Arcanobacterium wilhelmae]|uniref:Membrane-associated protease RseP (Regulator of RpoE activity) n=1 Tax=Arcanobacterium wilhelmae TaxID=1803177 RepID=A0ABT9N9B8_9ACTO|nr:site-2 protease family protein [Arcanobacterium wilhelmae]MDP9800307.1 membrane-associated protease RseP (regulator of RpoE activity) [Arcanobacterium wilhelmae]WFN89744.1 site-2 protease family protein [Arcanobacterium wilhelmae]
MSFTLGVVIFVLGILLSVGLHEFGHLIPAKLFGVLVPRYFIGFGPTLWSRKWRGTEWGVKAIPLGGFVSLAGMLAPAREGTAIRDADGRLTMAEEARRESQKEVPDGQEHRAFWRLSAPKRLVVMFGGPLTNFMLATVFVLISMTAIGVPQPSTTIGQVSECLTESCAQVAPAKAGGLRAGDRVLTWNGTPTPTWEAVQKSIAASPTSAVPVVVERGGSEVSLEVAPTLLEGRPGPVVGIAPRFVTARASVSEALAATGKLATATASVIVKLPVALWDVLAATVTGAPRDPGGIVGLVGVADAAGQIASAGTSEYTLAQRTGDMLMLLASLNMSLFVFNLLPLLPLDGGHMAGALWEIARRRWASLRGRPDPGPVDTARLWPLSQAVVAFFIVMTLALIVADILHPVL